MKMKLYLVSQTTKLGGLFQISATVQTDKHSKITPSPYWRHVYVRWVGLMSIKNMVTNLHTLLADIATIGGYSYCTAKVKYTVELSSHRHSHSLHRFTSQVDSITIGYTCIWIPKVNLYTDVYRMMSTHIKDSRSWGIASN